MRIPTPPTRRPPARPRARIARRSPSGPSCRWSSSAERVLDPGDAVRAVGQSFDADHIEAHGMPPPLRPAAYQELRGANNLALLDPVHGGQCTAEVHAAPLPHLDEGQHIAVEAYQIELTGPAAHIVLDDHETLGL